MKTEDDIAALPVATSFGALLRAEDRKREVKLPRKADFPDTVGWIRDERLGVDAPAVIGITGRFAGVGEHKGHRAAQWQVYVRPDHDRVAQRIAREDLVDLINLLHKELTALRPRKGASYTAYFSVPRGGDENVLRISFSGTGRFGTDPWSENDEIYMKVHGTIAARLIPVFENLWTSWTKDRTVAMLLGGRGIPIAANSKTQFQPGDTRRRIRDSLPEAMRSTVFLGALDDIDATPPVSVLDQPDPDTEVDYGHLFTMLGLITLAVAGISLVISAFFF